jgi:hypothetical protein
LGEVVLSNVSQNSFTFISESAPPTQPHPEPYQTHSMSTPAEL